MTPDPGTDPQAAPDGGTASGEAGTGTGSGAVTGSGRSTPPGAAGRRSGALAWLERRGELAVTFAAAAVAAAVVVPLVWLVRTALGVDPRVALSVAEVAEVAGNSALLVAAVTGASVALGVPLAYLTVRTDLPGRRLWTVASSLPLVIPSYIGAFAFVSAFGPRGAFQRALEPLGVERLPEIYGFPGAALVLTLYTYPYVFLTARAALKSMDARLVDAARTLRHGRLSAFRRITWPRIRPAVAAGALLVALYALSDFGTPAIMRFDVFTRVIYVELGSFGRDAAALYSLQLVVATLFILAIESRVRDRSEGRQTTGRGGRESRVRLGRWRWPATLLPAAVSGLALVVPLAILLSWLLAGPGEVGRSLAFRPEYAVNSVAVAGGAAVVATVAGLPVAYLAAHRPDSRFASIFERATYVGYGVPGVALGLALVFFGAQYATPIYQTVYLLVFAYVVRFLPQAVGSQRASFLGVDATLTDAARTLGRTPRETFRQVTLPLVAPGLVAGAALVFLTTMKELPATLLLKPSGFDTLVTRIWTAHESGHFGYAAVPALILLAVSAISLLLVLGQEGYDVK
jgi:iron(III) transport system permease protein